MRLQEVPEAEYDGRGIFFCYVCRIVKHRDLNGTMSGRFPQAPACAR